MKMNATHYGFSDESHWNEGRFRSIALVSLCAEYREEIEEMARKTLDSYGIEELKWKDIGGAQKAKAAKELCELAVQKAIRGILRVDVLTWDTLDSRHSHPGRDDLANLRHMHYHLLHNVLGKRWHSGSTWILCPDEGANVDWNNLERILNRKGRKVEVTLLPYATDDGFYLDSTKRFEVLEIRPTPSNTICLIQLADLFAGLSVFSWEKHREHWTLRRDKPDMRSLFDSADTNVDLYFKPSNSEKYRTEVLEYLHSLCRNYSLSVGFRLGEGIRTFKPNDPINFWLYIPQTPKDKAPVRSR